MDLLLSPEAWIAFATLTALELVLGIDNIIFISILVDRLPAHQRELALRIGLFAMWGGIVLLAEGFDHHVPKGYVYFAMAFSVVVELLNIRMRSREPKGA